MQEIAERLFKFRKKKGLRQLDIANKLGIKRTSYARIERGEIIITVPHLMKLHQEYFLNPSWVLLGVENVELDFDENRKIAQMLEDMKQDPALLHAILSLYFEKRVKKSTEVEKNGTFRS